MSAMTQRLNTGKRKKKKTGKNQLKQIKQHQFIGKKIASITNGNEQCCLHIVLEEIDMFQYNMDYESLYKQLR